MKFAFRVLCLVLCLKWLCAIKFQYHSNEEMEEILKSFNKTIKEPLRSELLSIGKSFDGSDLWVIQITATEKKKVNVPNVKLIGNIHGNEPVGREILIHFLHYLRDQYRKNATITWLLDNTRIFILPCLNPDGFKKSEVDSDCNNLKRQRENGSPNVDLNRSFPDFFHKNPIKPQGETKGIMELMKKIPFILSASFHGGALVANYPFDTIKVIHSNYHKPPESSLTPDDDVFKHLARTYTKFNQKLILGEEKCPPFKEGITNGAKWYSFAGSMQDYNYFKHGCMELTLEISCCKYPSENSLEQLWIENKDSIVAFSMQAHKGIAGQILDEHTSSPIDGAILQIVGRNLSFYSSDITGEYRRILLPGNYTLKVQAPGYYDKYVPFNISDDILIKNVYLTNSSIATTTTTEVSLMPVESDLENHKYSTIVSVEPATNQHRITEVEYFNILELQSNARRSCIFTLLLLIIVFLVELF